MLERPPRSRRPPAVLPKRLALLFATALPLLAPGAARAMCNVIPAATQDFRAALGSANRPFAGPGEWVELRVRPAICDSESTGFPDVNGNGTASDDYVATVLFVPPPLATAPANAVVLAESCTGLEPELASCDEALGAGTVECLEVNGTHPAGLVVESQSELQLRFPDTDARVGTGSDGLTLAGPAKLVVSRRGQSLHCELATQTCAGLGGTTDTNGIVACVDELYPLDGTCGTGEVDRTFGHWTALPKPNDFAAMCTTPGTACTNTAPELRFTTDLAGNALVPMDYTAVLLRPDGVPVAQLARAATDVEAVQGGGLPVALPGDRFIRSYSPEGVILPPIFTPLSDPSSADATLFGSVDAARGTIRIARQGCVGGDDEGAACTINSECSSNQCSALLFEFRDRYSASGIGPIVVPGGQYTATLDVPVPLEGLIDGDEAFGFVLSEALPPSGGSLVSRNADADFTDFVATLRNRDTGIEQEIGAAATEGRAVVRVRQPPFFSFPAVETSGDLLVLLESEPAEGALDANANGAVFDSLLRVFRLGTTAELTGGNVTADAAPLVNGRSFALLPDGRVFFRTSEAAEADQVVRMMSVDSDGVQPSAGNAEASTHPALSGNGRFVAFASLAKQLVAGDGNAIRDVFIHDRDFDADGTFDDAAAGGRQTAIISYAGSGIPVAPANGASDFPAITPDGRFVAFESDATNLASEANGISETDVFLRDRDPDQNGIFEININSLERAGLTDGELEPNGNSIAPHLSPDGRFVEFQSLATNLVPGDANGDADIFVRDRTAGATARTSVFDDGSEGNGTTGSGAGGTLSADGRYALLSTDAPLVAGDANGVADAFVRDRDGDGDGIFDEPSAASTSLVNLTSFGAPASGGGLGGASALTPEGRFLAFQTDAPELTGGGPTGVFVHDRDADGDGVYGETAAQALPEISTVRADVTSAGEPGNDWAVAPTLPADGRLVGFESIASNLEPGDANDFSDVFLHDTVTGHTLRASSVGGIDADGASSSSALSADGRYLAFESTATNLVAGDTNGFSDIFVRGPDPQDPDLAAKDRSGDGQLDDIVLRVLDPSTGPPATITDLCPAQHVAVANGLAAFLRPEAAGSTSASSNCSGQHLNGPPLNADSDAADLVVHLTDGSNVANLRCAATAVALSATRLAALVSEAGEGNGGTDLNGDVDERDGVLFVRDPSDTAFNNCTSGESWVNTQQAADAIALSGDRVVLLTREADQNSSVLNGDGDALDRVVRLVDGASPTGALVPIVGAGQQSLSPQAAEEFVVGTELVAFRTREAAQGVNLNRRNPNGSCDPLQDDCDEADDVLQIYLLATGELINTGEAVLPCFLVACDPGRPYRVSPSTVRFLTLESQQNEDLNDDGDEADLLVQVYNVQTREARVVGEIAIDAAVAGDPATSVDPLAAPEPDSGQAAAGEQVLLTRGRCVVDSLVSCTVASPVCASGHFCYAASGPTGTCVHDVGQTCLPDKQPAGEQGCSTGAECIDDLVAIGIADADADEVPDALDNCPAISNVAQADLDGDGVGDACDLETCSNAVLELGEECEDTDLLDGDGCDSNCRVTACSNGIRTDPEQCDDGNALAVDGCTAACLIEVADAWAFAGEATGGSVSFRVGGIDFTVTTLLGQTAAEVAASVAAAIRAHPALAGHAVYAAGTGSSVISNAAITNRSISDPGLTPAAVSSLGAPALAALALGLLLAGLLALRHAPRASA